MLSSKNFYANQNRKKLYEDFMIMTIFICNNFAEWRRFTIYCYQDIQEFYRDFIQENSQVTEIGSTSCDLRNNIQVEEEAMGCFSQLDISILDDGFLLFCGSERLLDYILLTNTVNYLTDVIETLNELYSLCQASTRLVVTFNNPSWRSILKFAFLITQRRRLPQMNWLSYNDIENILQLCQFQVVCHSKRLLLPKYIPLLSWFCNRIFAPLPLINQLCLNEYIIARPVIPLSANLTCSVIIPARNEVGNIEDCVINMPRLGTATEIIFIEGGSEDKTWEEILRVQEKYSDRFNIRAFRQSGQGKKDAVWQGFEMATGDVLIILDADLTVQTKELVYFFKAIADGTCEFANGCRLTYPLSQSAMPWLNGFANRIFAFLLSYLLNTTIKDSLCGTKAMSHQNYLKLKANRHYFGDLDPFGDFDLLLGAAKLGLKIMDIPVRYHPRTYGKSNISHIRDGLILLKMLFHAAIKIKFM
jgi:hypothetical protein